jgi:hypothetical protein
LQLLPVVFALAFVGLVVVFGTWLARHLMNATPTPDGDTVANRMLGRSPGDYAAEQEALADRRLDRLGPALPKGLRRLEVAACAAMGLGLINPWAVLAGPFSPKLYPLDTLLGGGFGLLLAAAAILVYREATHGAGRTLRVALAILAATLVAVAVAAALDPPVAAGLRVVRVGVGLWLCLAGSLTLLGAGLLALPRPAGRRGERAP